MIKVPPFRQQHNWIFALFEKLSAAPHFGRFRVFCHRDELDHCIIHEISNLDILKVAWNVDQNMSQFGLDHIVDHFLESIHSSSKTSVRIRTIKSVKELKFVMDI